MGSLAMTGVGLIVASILFKISVFPFHVWVPDVYQGSPDARDRADGDRHESRGDRIPAQRLLPAAELSRQPDRRARNRHHGRRLLRCARARRSQAHAGLLGHRQRRHSDPRDRPELSLTPSLYDAARTAALYYIGAYVFTITGAFGLIALFERDGERFTRLTSLAGLATKRPAMAAAMTIFVLSLGGIPATGGFLGKWFVFSVLVNANMIGFAVIGAVLSVIALAFYLRIVITMWMLPADEAHPIPGADRPAHRGSLQPPLCVAGVILTGILPGLFI